MSSTVTEIACLPLIPNTDLHSGEGKKLLDSALEVSARQPGFQRAFWGMQIENVDVLVIVVGTHIIFISPPLFSSLCISILTPTQYRLENMCLIPPT